MSVRLATGLLVSAVLRRVHDDGGNGAVLARGDRYGGAMLFLLYEKGGYCKAIERSFGADGAQMMRVTGPEIAEQASAIADYWQRRRRQDPDLWVIELDSPNAERFTAETIIGA
ncbi:MAG: DUF1491 family protein [Sphingomonas sp.]|jgi:hypothetical protein